MTLLFLIFKIIGCILLGILGMLILAISIILFLPIDYRVYYEKYVDSVIHANVRLFYMIRINYEQAEERHELIIKLFGITLKKINLTEEDLEEVREETKEDVAHSAKVTTKPQPAIISESDKKVKVPKINKGSTKAKTQKQSYPKQEKKAKEQESIIDQMKRLWQSSYRKGFFEEIRGLLKKVWLELKPRTIKFKLIIGKDDPAETGELIAKLTMLYPLIYRYGIIEGDYTEAGFWGEVMGAGRIRLFNLVKAVVIFGLNKDVRNFIKIILNVRKVEANGI